MVRIVKPLMLAAMATAIYCAGSAAKNCRPIVPRKTPGGSSYMCEHA
jgi:hypothetical protein